MAKKETYVQATVVYDGNLDATELFVTLIFEKYNPQYGYLAKMQAIPYNEDMIQKAHEPSGLCR